ncbi:MAG: hypothetical protein EOM87_01570 [Clostridia bacterium]|nr:hypothetical protein [Clostridia bacterium]
MKKISNYLGRQIINLAVAKEEGIIINGMLDDKLKKLSYFVIVNEENYEDLELLLPLKSVLQGTDILYITNSNFVENPEAKFIKCPLNARVFNTDGELIGIVKDITFDDKGYTQSLVLENGEILQKEVVTASSSLVTVKGLRKIRASRKKPVKTPNVEEMMNSPEATENYETYESYESYEDAPERKHCAEADQPPRIIADYSFLLGRKVTKDIRSYGAEILIPENTIIDDCVVKLARHNGKLVELTVNSK